MFKKKSICIFLGIFIFGTFFYILTQNISNIFKDEPKLSSSYKISEIFKSERSFGNDYFDIYEIRRVDYDLNLDYEKKIDDFYYDQIKSFKNIINSYGSDINDGKKLLKAINSLEKLDDTKYYFEENKDKDGHKLIYIYNPNLNIGYVFDFQI